MSTYSIDAELAQLAAPLREKLARVEADYAEVSAQRDQLRADRMKIVTALRAVDPTFAAELAKPKAKSGGVKGIAAETLDTIGAYLETHRAEFSNGGGFTATDITKRDDFQWSLATASTALRALHERGILRLDHTGTGGGKWFVLV